jgi:non-ribosomal peptide synthetase component E (peptide arylation enzyme)
VAGAVGCRADGLLHATRGASHPLQGQNCHGQSDGVENVSSIEVEDVIFSHPAVAEVAVIVVPDEKWG